MIQKRSLLLGLVVLLAACGSPTGPALQAGELFEARSNTGVVETTETASQNDAGTASATEGTETEGTTEARGGGSYAGSSG